MASQECGLASAYVLGLAEVVARWNISEAELLEPLALTRADLLRPRAQVDAPTLLRIVRRAELLTGEPGLPVFLGLHMRVAMHGFVGFAAMSAATVRESTQLLERFSRILLPATWRLDVDGARATMTLTVHPGFAELHELIVVSTFVGIARMAPELVGHELDGRAELALAKPAYYDRLRHLLPPGEVRFGCAVDRLVFPSAMLDQPIVASDPVAVQLATAHCERELATLGERGSWVLRVLETTRARDGRFRKLEEVAKLLAVSPRSLKRHLANANTTFSDLLDEAKHQRATDLLLEGAKIESVARELGYADIGSFLRAFRRWTGMTPGEFRKRVSADS